MRSRNVLMLIFSLILLTIIGTGCTSNDNALKDENGKVVNLTNKEQPTLLFFFTGIG